MALGGGRRGERDRGMIRPDHGISAASYTAAFAESPALAALRVSRVGTEPNQERGRKSAGAARHLVPPFPTA
jgi:hypothetical protein